MGCKGKSRIIFVVFALMMLVPPVKPASAETLDQALALAYANNPQLNAARAGLRATDEGVAIAKSGMRPTVEGTGSYSKTWARGASDFTSGSFGVTISQTLFDGFRTANAISGSKSAVNAARENLRNTEINILFDTVSAYMTVISSAAIVGYNKQSIDFLNEQVRSEKSRFEVGESTRTDVAQADAARSLALAQLSAAQADYNSAKADYRQIVGKDPVNLKKPKDIKFRLPHSQAAALSISLQNHPSILSARHSVDQALYGVKQAEGELLPNISIEGSVNHTTNSLTGNTETSKLTANLNVPLYQGGGASAKVRQFKELLGQSRILIDLAIDQVRALVASAYGNYLSAINSSSANRAQLEASKLILQGIVEERRVGQATTLDVLNTQQAVIRSQIDLARSENNLVVSSYAILSSMGSLSASRLALKVETYEPEEHYQAVKDKWFGLRTPNGQ